MDTRAYLLHHLVEKSSLNKPMPFWFGHAIQYCHFGEIEFPQSTDPHEIKAKEKALHLYQLIQSNSFTITHLHENGLWIPALMAAAEKNDLERVKDLLTERQPHPLSRWLVARVASENGHTNLVRNMLDEKSTSTNTAGPFCISLNTGDTGDTDQLLLSLARIPNMFVKRLLRERRKQHAGNEQDWSTGRFPRPNPMDTTMWYPAGFTALHFAVVFKREEIVREMMVSRKVKVVEDKQGLTACDWAEAVGLGQNVFSGSDADFNVTSLKKQKAVALYQQWMEMERGKQKLRWAFEMEEAVLGGDWARVKYLATEEGTGRKCLATKEGTGNSTEEGTGSVLDIDENVWEHLKWLFGSVCRNANLEHIRPALEKIVLKLLSCMSSASVRDSCLNFAIRNHMIVLAEELVRTGCDVLTAEPGFLSPLEVVDYHQVNKRLLTVMAQRDDVKQWLRELRQIQVEYASTLLVAGALIAGLAFQGWLQPPLGFTASDGMDLHTLAMRVFTYSNNFGFWFAVGTLVAAATAAIPWPQRKRARTQSDVSADLMIASLFMAASVVFVAVAFAAAGISVVSYPVKKSSFIFLSLSPAALIFFLLIRFRRRLSRLFSFSWLPPFGLESLDLFDHRARLGAYPIAEWLNKWGRLC